MVCNIIPKMSLAIGLVAPMTFGAHFEGVLDYQLAIDSDDAGLQQSQWELTPRLDFRPASFMDISIIPRLRIDSEDKIAPGKPDQDSRSHWNRRWYPNDYSDVEIRELYADSYIQDVFIRAGKQQVVWGQADGLKVLDVINPTDYHEFILPSSEDRRIPLWMINAEIPVAGGTLQTLFIPDTTYDEIPASNAAFAMTTPMLVPTAPASVPVRVADYDKPDDPIADADAGARWQTFIGGWDISLNYFYHYSDQAVFMLESDSSGITVKPQYRRTHTVGTTFSNAFGDYVLRGELGYSTRRYWVADPTRVSRGIVRSPELSYVAGLDYNGISNTLISTQLYQSYLTDHAEAIVRDVAETQVTLLIRRNFWNQTLELEAFGIQSLNDMDRLVQLKGKYLFPGNISVHLGADLFFGDEDGLFGQFRDSSRILAGFSYSF
ncbi:DUF1302 family protein [Gynuella sunshinyii]|uniref:Uncharacterized protein n=1 Tax=Gynuella sunshinyii YC6258 TaxID=1445510 RepID=A0A0C5VU26_9GAMM|nr:DUF1302 family protein [Gynuella sunshinyii]AJQ96793.1 hypothetical Protein YC6258_04761 [Gynuella sunshinyii YC6258]